MIAFLLGLLKIIGIILLVLLILLLVILGVVLFVPIYYSGTGQISEEKKEASAQVTWLLRAVRCRVDYVYTQKPKISVKILGIDVLKLLEKRGGKEKASSKENTPVENEVDLPKANTINETKSEELTEKETKTATEQGIDAEKTAEVSANEESTIGKEEASKERKSISKKLEAIIDKIKNIIYNINYYINIFQEEDTKQLLADAWGAIIKILKSIRPRIFKLCGEIGFATPDTTGKLYGLYAMLLPTIGEYIQIEPNFEEQIIRGNLKLKGRITLFVILVNVLRILFDKRLKPLIKKLKNGGNRNGRE